ncbi:glycosyltransferase family 87 protein [Ornithinimicrobium cryptoxanthini]|uniref:DUF2029 domain-containing protein n=1 Tax=Ornithinimicrobium cryptoxanthini TaxID=2934161 RepID=A0ABY4YMU5_9MICO|nr:glycosyltransferase family 87 protein [Ornithinimicrobium cryptoxanthini]USQ77472.1 DUF2029 domain-containing protein [Ornithinimicrobium cryptoxanthini]
MLIGPDPFMVDFVARWTGGRIASQSAFGNLYDPITQMEYQSDLFKSDDALSWFVGPPFEAVILAPFGALPYPVATLIWTGASAAALVISLRTIGKHAPSSVLNWQRFVIIALASVPITELLYSGQNTAFVLLWLALSHRAMNRNRPFVAGLIIGLALVKPHLIALIPWLWLLERRWSALAGLATTTAAWVVLSLFVVGPDSVSVWLGALQSGPYVDGVHEGQTLKNTGLVGLLTPWLPNAGNAPWQSVATVTSLSLGLLAVLYIHKKTSDSRMRWWLVVLVATLAAPHSMTYDLVLGIPALALVMVHRWTASLRVSTAIAWIALWVVPALGLLLSALAVAPRIAQTPWHAIPVLVLAALAVKDSQKPHTCQPPSTNRP